MTEFVVIIIIVFAPARRQFARTEHATETHNKQALDYANHLHYKSSVDSLRFSIFGMEEST